MNLKSLLPKAMWWIWLWENRYFLGKWYIDADCGYFNWWTWFYGLKIRVGTATITYGNFIQNVVDFLIVAACIFAMLKFLAHFKKTTNDQLDQKESKQDDTVVLLEEIRDLLKKIDKVN